MGVPALYLADRIISDKPSRILRTIELPMARPRDLFRDPEIGRLRTKMRDLFRTIQGMGDLLEAGQQ